MCLHWICYLVVILDMCLMPLVVCAWWLFSYLDICDLWTDKPLWLDGYFQLVDKACVSYSD